MKTVDDIEQPTHRPYGGGPSGAAGARRLGSPPADRRPGLLGRLWRKVRNGAVARGTAAIWMTMLIALPVAVAFLTVWGGPARATHPDDLSVAALKLFSVWCLSFLPGWLYVRFLGQRAGAL